MAAAPAASAPIGLLEAYVATRGGPVERTAEESERETLMELAKLWRAREFADAQREPSLATIPRFFVKKPGGNLSATGPSERARTQHLQAELGRFARSKLREHMSSLILSLAELEQLWRLLKQHTSPPVDPNDERINYDDFCQVAEAMPAHCARAPLVPGSTLVHSVL